MAPDGSTTARRDETPDPARLESLLIEGLETVERDGPAALEAFLAAHSPQADELRRRLEMLGEMGLVDRPEAGERRIGDFRLIRPIGRGGMGTVWLAEQESLRRLVALKLLRMPPATSSAARARAQREAEAVARLDHPSIVSVFGAGEHADTFWIAMQLVPGQSLDAVLESGRPSVRDAIRWGRDLALALGYTHGQGIIHRDVKPSNIRITPEGRAMLLDFGLARIEQDGRSMTLEFQGSPLYSAPEQVDASAGRVGPQTDVYALGVTLYQCLTGELPFRDTTTQRIFHAILAKEPLPPRRLEPRIPRDLETVVRKAMEKNPAERYPSAHALANDLDAVLELRSIAARPPSGLGRAVRWVRRNRGTAAALALALLAPPVALAVQSSRDAETRRAAARDALERTRSELAALRSGRTAAAAQEAALAEFTLTGEQRYLTREEIATWDRLELSVAAGTQHREAAFTRMLDLLRAAATLAPSLPDVDELRAEIFLERWREAELRGHAADARLYRSLVDSVDPARRHADELAGLRRVAFESSPAGAQVTLFRLVPQSELDGGGESRCVPVPAFGPLPDVRPGTWGLAVRTAAAGFTTTDVIVSVAGQPIEGSVLVLDGSNGLERGDRLARIDDIDVRDPFEVASALAGPAKSRRFTFARGELRFERQAPDLAALGVRVARPRVVAEAGGVAAEVWRDGRIVPVTLPLGLDLRTTAAPFLATQKALLGTTPTAAVEVPPGVYVAILHREGFADRRLPLRVRRAQTGEMTVAQGLWPLGATPPGFVYVANVYERGSPPRPGFWMMEHEVTAGDYLEFLNDLSGQGHDTEDLAPRVSDASGTAGPWRRGTGGAWSLSAGWQPDLPIHGVSWLAAKRYARWYEARLEAAGHALRCDLPTFEEWQDAQAGGRFDWRFCFGNQMRSHWVKSCFSRQQPVVEPVLAFPIDESPHGVRDMAGSVAEWLDGWLWEEKRQRQYGGGAWSYARTKLFETTAVQGQVEDQGRDSVGFRLVAWRAGERRP